MQRFVTEPESRRPVRGEWDVVVAGGGMSGVVAAVAARRMGATVALMEGKAYLGGVGTMGLPVQGYFDTSNRQIVKGIAQEIVDRLRRIGGASESFIHCELHNPFLIVDIEAMKRVCQEMVLEAGIDLHFHTVASDVMLADRRITALLAESKSGREAYLGNYYVDATGDGDLAARAGVPFWVGREEDGLTQSSTLMFRLDNVQIDVLVRRILECPEQFDLIETLPRKQFRYNRKHIVVGLRNLIEHARDDGLTGIPWDRVCYITMLELGAVAINMVHVRGLVASEADGLTQVEIEGRRQIPTVVRFLREYVPGFEECRLTSSAGWAGIRETRHITGAYTLTQDDVTGGARFEDAIAVGGYPIDIHSPSEDDVSLTKVPPYDIPYRCVTPQGVENLLTTGRSISATHGAIASARVMATCMAVSHGVGIAAALGARGSTANTALDVAAIRRALVEQGAFLQ